MKNFLKNNYKIIIICLSVLGVAILGSIFVNLGITWYSTLLVPKQWIPNYIIPVVWSVIYILFAVILSILSKNNILSLKSIYLCIINGLLNVLWCLIFFTLNQLLVGNILIILNVFLGVMLLLSLNKTNKTYVNWLWIYVIWLFVATSFNLALWILN